MGKVVARMHSYTAGVFFVLFSVLLKAREANHAAFSSQEEKSVAQVAGFKALMALLKYSCSQGVQEQILPLVSVANRSETHF